MQEIPFQGEVKVGHNVQIGYFAQNQAQMLDGELTVFDTIDRVARGDIRLKIRDILGAFMFGSMLKLMVTPALVRPPNARAPTFFK